VIKLSKLEEDFVGDLAQDNHGVWEAFEFARFHYPGAVKSEVWTIGRDLLNSWISRGWLEVRSGVGDPLPTSALTRLLDEGPGRAMQPLRDSLWLVPASRAFEDITWLRLRS
jgi:hypothetical protein